MGDKPTLTPWRIRLNGDDVEMSLIGLVSAFVVGVVVGVMLMVLIVVLAMRT